MSVENSTNIKKCMVRQVSKHLSSEVKLSENILGRCKCWTDPKQFWWELGSKMDFQYMSTCSFKISSTKNWPVTQIWFAGVALHVAGAWPLPKVHPCQGQGWSDGSWCKHWVQGVQVGPGFFSVTRCSGSDVSQSVIQWVSVMFCSDKRKNLSSVKSWIREGPPQKIGII